MARPKMTPDPVPDADWPDPHLVPTVGVARAAELVGLSETTILRLLRAGELNVVGELDVTGEAPRVLHPPRTVRIHTRDLYLWSHVGYVYTAECQPPPGYRPTEMYWWRPPLIFKSDVPSR